MHAETVAGLGYAREALFSEARHFCFLIILGLIEGMCLHMNFSSPALPSVQCAQRAQALLCSSVPCHILPLPCSPTPSQWLQRASLLSHILLLYPPQSSFQYVWLTSRTPIYLSLTLTLTLPDLTEIS